RLSPCLHSFSLCLARYAHHLYPHSFPNTTLFRSLVRDHHKKSELTLYLNEGCFSDPKNELFTWVDANLPKELEDGLDRVTQVKRDRKSTRLNSSHRTISYAVFCLKKKNKKIKPQI